jgi:undecaprenyl-diphosphatase
VIVGEKLMGLDPTSPEMTLLLVMLHTGTMLAVIVYFWSSWRKTYFSSMSAFLGQGKCVLIATAATGVVGMVLLQIIKWAAVRDASGFEIEQLFGNARLMSAALAAGGVLILATSRLDRGTDRELTARSAAWIGAVQGLCLPFRGFSRSGATISTGLAFGVGRRRAEEFSFALAVVLTPAVIVREAWRLLRAHDGVGGSAAAVSSAVGSSLLGMAFSFAAGLLALRLLSQWLEQGRWHWFGIYCLIAALAVLRLA